ncbi:hypothetical protein JTE90_007035 [Oedothorax gibbosus]|uniref:Uncharacterized protein n=1 Tax=Oedothorax gibbosus TaxID=931172 RepID=A0AAV6U8B9_9ARAC|nr:hypothetical protein JTE90_007035 [Oedothorax gibbosus]
MGYRGALFVIGKNGYVEEAVVTGNLMTTRFDFASWCRRTTIQISPPYDPSAYGLLVRPKNFISAPFAAAAGLQGRPSPSGNGIGVSL